MSTKSDALTRIAHMKARNGQGWDALVAQLASDAHVLGDILGEHPNALVDVGPVRALDLTSADLLEAIGGCRELLCQALEPVGLAGAFRHRLGGLPDANPAVDDSAAKAFASAWLEGDAPAEVAGRLRRKAGRLYALSRRLEAGHDREGAVRSATAAARTCFVAHHMGESNPNDPDLSMLQAALLLADEQLESHQFPESDGLDIDRLHDVLDEATLAPTPVPWP